MPDYIFPPITTEPDDLAAEAFAYLEDAMPGWSPAPGNLEVWLTEALAQLAGELADVEAMVPTAIFRYFGATLLNLPPHDAVPASATSAWTMIDALGYTIPAGTLVGIPITGDELAPFEVVDDVVIAPGATTATSVVLVAVEPGVAANGLTTAPEVIDALDSVESVALEAPTSGGVDAELDAAYLGRLRELLTLLSPRPILADDFAALARTVAGVDRATAIDNYNLDTDEDDVERAVTVIVAGADGEPVGPLVLAEVDALLEAEREVNFLVFVGDPTYTDVDVAFIVKPYPDYDAADVVARTIEAVELYLSPATFGSVPYGEAPRWLADTKVRYLEVAEVVNGVEGVWFIDTLSVEGGTADVTLAGVAPLPHAGAVTGSAI